MRLELACSAIATSDYAVPGTTPGALLSNRANPAANREFLQLLVLRRGYVEKPADARIDADAARPPSWRNGTASYAGSVKGGGGSALEGRQFGRYTSLSCMPDSCPGFFSSSSVSWPSSFTPETGARPREVPFTQTMAQGVLTMRKLRAPPTRRKSSCTL